MDGWLWGGGAADHRIERSVLDGLLGGTYCCRFVVGSWVRGAGGEQTKAEWCVMDERPTLNSRIVKMLSCQLPNRQLSMNEQAIQ